MVFNSIEYYMFLGVVLVLYYLFPLKIKKVLLLLSSMLFYAIWNIDYTIVLIFITLSSYLAGLKISKTENIKIKKKYVIVNIIICLFILIFFKYTNFLLSIAYDSYNIIASSNKEFVVNIILPIGISYYTFRAISYTFDIYWGKLNVENNLLDYAIYISFFPSLFSGPIDRAGNIIPQLKSKINLTEKNIVYGLQLILWGLFKKFVIADRLALYTNFIFGSYQNNNGLPLIFASVLWVFQLYCDFSAYSDIAIGSAKLFGIDLIQNFNRPFISKSITDLWRRWHISMSFWFRDYVFMPLTISKRDWGKLSVVFSFTITFILVGLWHGASWNWIFFGFLQGIAVTFEFIFSKRITRITKKVPKWIVDKVSMAATFSYFTFSCIFFKFDSLKEAFHFISNMFNFKELNTNLIITNAYIGKYGHFEFIVGLLSIAFVLLIESLNDRSQDLIMFARKPQWFRWGFYYLLIFGILMLGEFNQSEFIYMGF